MGEGRPAGDWQAEPPVRPLVYFPTAVNYSAIFKWFVLSLFPQVHLRQPTLCTAKSMQCHFLSTFIVIVYLTDSFFLAALAALYLQTDLKFDQFANPC